MEIATINNTTTKMETYFPQIKNITQAQLRLQGVVRKTPLEFYSRYVRIKFVVHIIRYRA